MFLCIWYSFGHVVLISSQNCIFIIIFIIIFSYLFFYKALLRNVLLFSVVQALSN